LTLKKFNKEYGHTWLLKATGGRNGAKYQLIHLPSLQHSVCLISTIDSAISIVQKPSSLNNRSYFKRNNPSEIWEHIRHKKNINLFGEVLRHWFFITDWQQAPYWKYHVQNACLCDESSNRYDSNVAGIGCVEMIHKDGVLMFFLPDGSILINDECEEDSGWMWTTKDNAEDYLNNDR